MAVVSGTFGFVQVDDATIAQVRNWTMNRNQEIQEYTVLGSLGYRNKRPLFKNENVDAELYWDATDTTGQGALETAYATAAPVQIKIYPTTATGTIAAGDVFYEGTCYISDLSVTGDSEDLVGGTANFATDGPMTRGVEPA